MYIFIDESGIHKQDGKSTIALVYLSVENLDKFQNNMLVAEQKMGIDAFHWSHSTWNIREKFVQALSKQDFFVKIAFIKNPFKETYGYEFALQHLVIEKDIIAVIIDGKKDKKYGQNLKKVLRDKGISVRKLKTANDGTYPAIRAADAIAGIVRYHDEDRNNKRIEKLYMLIAKKIMLKLQE